MSVSARIVAGNFPYGNPGSVGEPLGVWLAHGVITGDATGGTAELRFVPQNPTDTPTLQDQRREYVYFVDGMRATADGDPGNWSSRIVMHMARSNSTFTPPFEHIRHGTTITDGFTFGPSTPLMDERMTRTPIFWDTQELASGNDIICEIRFENNVDTRNYSLSAYGRYYGRTVIGNRAFGRLVGPPALSQFEG